MVLLNCDPRKEGSTKRRYTESRLYQNPDPRNSALPNGAPWNVESTRKKSARYEYSINQKNKQKSGDFLIRLFTVHQFSGGEVEKHFLL